MKEKNVKKNKRELISAAFLMGTTAIGPGFLVQNALFTSDYGASFGFVILISVIISIIAQLNIWRVLCVSGIRGQDLANRVIPGLGYVISVLVISGAIAFNIGNVGGGALGLSVLTGLPVKLSTVIVGGFAVCIFLVKNAKGLIDRLTKVLCSVLIIVIVIMIFLTKPPLAAAAVNTFVPETGPASLIPAIVTIVGATIGGYVTFSGAHRLIDAGVTGKENLREIEKSSVMGIGITAFVRVLFFLAILGVVVNEGDLDPDNPAVDAFYKAAGDMGYVFAGIVMLCASITPIISAAYTSVSFVKTFHPVFERYENRFIIGVIVISAVIMASIGRPAELLVIASAFNGLILPIILSVCLIACHRKDITGEDYRQPKVLTYGGAAVVVIMTFFGLVTFGTQIGTLI